MESVIEIKIEEIKESKQKVFDKIKNYETTIIICKCIICGSKHKLIISTKDLCLWLSGKKFIQDALITLSPAKRELLLSQICDKCWENLRPDDENDEY